MGVTLACHPVDGGPPEEAEKIAKGKRTDSEERRVSPRLSRGRYAVPTDFAP